MSFANGGEEVLRYAALCVVGGGPHPCDASNKLTKPRKFKQFTQYNSEELEAAGEAFVEDACARRDKEDTKSWTAWVLGWFAATAAMGVKVYPRNRQGRVSPGAGEFVVDHCHVEEPDYKGGSSVREWYKNADKFQMLLALESEWGKSRSETNSVEMALDDANKLAVVRARVKVMIVATADGSSAETFFDELEKLRGNWGDERPWLLVDLPWRGTKVSRRTLTSLPPAVAR